MISLRREFFHGDDVREFSVLLTTFLSAHSSGKLVVISPRRHLFHGEVIDHVPEFSVFLNIFLLTHSSGK